jgi:hypothetical protein
MPQVKLFTGQPIFTQLLSFIPKTAFEALVHQCGADRYCKSFYAWDHLVSMLYSCFHKCESLRELVTGLQVNFNKLIHLGVRSIPRRSTLSDANRRRPEALLAGLYHVLLKRYYPADLPDSSGKKDSISSRLFILDSTTISLFSDIMKGAGRPPASGKRKGGLKAHVLVKAEHDLPCFVVLSPASHNDRTIYKHINLPPKAIVVFDKGYGNFRQFDQWSKQKVSWVSRFGDAWTYQSLEQRKVSVKQQSKGILSDEKVLLGNIHNKKTLLIKVRRIVFFDEEQNRTLIFVTNNFKMQASRIADIYKRRWQIELLFKRIKRHYPLRYFLGESENAIKIQIWCALICDLLVKIVKDKLKRPWSFANIASMIRLHLMTYINIFSFFNNPENALKHYNSQPQGQLSLFPYPGPG